jgi:hypothetical protein
MNLNKTVIKVINKEHGAKVIKWFKNQGIDTDGLSGCLVGNYYGFNESIKLFDYWVKIPTGYTVIELPNELPKRGDRIMVGYYGVPSNERIFLTFIEGVLKPVVCVAGGEELDFEKNEIVGTTCWQNYELIKPIKEVELTLDEIAAKFNITVDQLKIKK